MQMTRGDSGERVQKCPAELPVLCITGWLAWDGAEAEHHWNNPGAPPWLQRSCR